MRPGVHVDMTRTALESLMSRRALRAVIVANVLVDVPWNQLGRHEMHFDDNEFEKSYAFMDAEGAMIHRALKDGRPEKAWRAFGRLTHTAQDYYSHSNYVDLWISRFPEGAVPPPPQIDPLDADILRSPALRSGRPYFPLGLLSLLPVIGALAGPFLPADSHAAMHLDSAARGPRFHYAYQAAVKRTRAEYDRLAGGLSKPLLGRFRDLQTGTSNGAPAGKKRA